MDEWSDEWSDDDGSDTLGSELDDAADPRVIAEPAPNNSRRAGPAITWKSIVVEEPPTRAPPALPPPREPLRVDLSDLLARAEELHADASIPHAGPRGVPLRVHRCIISRDEELIARVDAGDQGCTTQEGAGPGLRVRALYGGDESEWEATREHMLSLARALGEPSAHSDVQLALDPAAAEGPDGAARYYAHKCVLAWRSEWFRAAIDHAARAGAGLQPLIQLPAECTRALTPPLLAYLYGAEHEVEREALLTPELVVPCARAANVLLLAELKRHAVQLMQASIDDANAPSLLQEASVLAEPSLQRACVEHMVARLDAVSSGEYFGELPQSTREMLAKLRHASRCNPLCRGARLGDARELLAMLRESLDAQRAVHEQAVQRQREEVHAASAQCEQMSSSWWSWAEPRHDAPKARWERIREVDERIARQGAQIDALRHFIRAQEDALADYSLHSTRQPSHH